MPKRPNPTNLLPLDFNGDNQRPLPEIIAGGNADPEEGWPSFALAFRDVDGKRYYAIQDWIRGVAQIDDAKQIAKFWRHIQDRLRKTNAQSSEFWRTLPYKASDGKTYKRDHTDAEGLYRITQRLSVNTGIRDRVLMFLAQAGVYVDGIRLDPDKVLEDLPIDPDKALDAVIRAYQRQGKTDGWIQVRLQSSIQRNKFTKAFKLALREKPQQMHFAIVTDEIRLGLWKRTTAQLRAELELRKDANLRDHQSELALTYEILTEQISERELRQQSAIPFEQARDIVRADAEFVGKHAEETGRRLNIDIATDRPLLSSRNRTENLD